MRDVPYTKDKMRLYVDKYKRNGMVRAVDLPLDSKEDALADVAAAAFAPANQMDVHIDENYIRTDQVQLRDFTLTDRSPARQGRNLAWEMPDKGEEEVGDGR